MLEKIVPVLPLLLIGLIVLLVLAVLSEVRKQTRPKKRYARQQGLGHHQPLDLRPTGMVVVLISRLHRQLFRLQQCQ